jgi:peptidoglycan pentaglycine glycine transferase (the first glycine)
MEVQPWSEQESWDGFLKQIKRPPFQQSWAWGEFRQAIGSAPIRLAIIENQKVIGVVLAFHDRWRFGQSTLTVLSGPVIDPKLSTQQYFEVLNMLLQALVNEAKSRRVIFFHVELPIENSNAALVEKLAHSLKFSSARALQATDTLVLDLRKTSEQLLNAMHEKTRYNIRLAEKKGVQIFSSTGMEARENLKSFLLLNKQTTARDKFASHAPMYYGAMLQRLPPEMIKVYVANYEQQAIAANIIITFGDTTTYVHGASGNLNRNVMAPYLLQWRQILDAQISGSQCYDFFGIETPERPRTSWAGGSWVGITRFKQGFQGQVVSSVGAYELPLRRSWYRILNIRRKFK